MLGVAVLVLAVLAVAGSTGPEGESRPKLAIAAALVALLSPLLVPGERVFLRFLIMDFGVLVLGRSCDLLLRPQKSFGFWRRVWFLLALFDLRQLVRRAPGLARAESLWLLVHLGLVALGVGLVYGLGPGLGLGPGHPGYWLIRWAGGGLLFYGLVEVLHSSFLVAYRALGMVFPRINDRPILSRTLGEFWGRRWNRVVGGWLRSYLYFPLARSGRAGLGVAAAFAASTLLHFWVAWVPLDVGAGATMASFFVIQGGGVALERRLGADEWPPTRQRIWFASWFLLTGPLFIEPILRMLGAP